MTDQFKARLAFVEAEIKLLKMEWLKEVKKRKPKKKPAISEGEQMALHDWENRGKKRKGK